LHGICVDERLLQRVQLAVTPQTLDRRDLFSVQGQGKRHAGIHRQAVDVDRAAPATTGIAAPFGGEHPQAFAQYPQQGVGFFHGDFVDFVIDVDLDDLLHG
jgi:hypothetical protein